MRRFSTLLALALLSAAVVCIAPSGAEPGATVIDRTVECRTLLNGGIYEIEARAHSGVRANPSAWKTLPFAVVTSGSTGSAATQLDNALVWITAGRPSRDTWLEGARLPDSRDRERDAGDQARALPVDAREGAALAARARRRRREPARRDLRLREIHPPMSIYLLQSARNRMAVLVQTGSVRQDMKGRFVLLQRLRNRTWSTIGRKRLVVGRAGGAGFTYEATFPVSRRWTVRGVVPAQTAAPCFATNTTARRRT